jgi:adenosine deaminase
VTVELHRHFEAGLTPETLARLAARHHVTEVRTRAGLRVEGVDPQDPASIRAYYASIAAGFGLPDGSTRFQQSFGLPLSVLRTLEDLEQAAVDEVTWCAERGSLHTELRGSPFT